MATCSSSMRDVMALNATTAGMATANPAAVAMRAAAMGGARICNVALFMDPKTWKVAMIPHTVPKSPMNGAALPVVARRGK